jgi:hypothetical protein
MLGESVDGAIFGQNTDVKPFVKPLDKTRLIAGHTARGYEFYYHHWTGVAVNYEGLGLDVRGEVWIAGEGPYLDELIRSPFFRGATMGSSIVQATAPDLITALGLLGPIIERSEAVTLQEGEYLKTLLHSTSSFQVTQIFSQPKDDEYFSGFERQEQACDCSCGGWNQLEALTKLSKKEQAAHPKSMTLAMCGPKCMAQWIPCAQKK